MGRPAHTGSSARRGVPASDRVHALLDLCARLQRPRSWSTISDDAFATSAAGSACSVLPAPLPPVRRVHRDARLRRIGHFGFFGALQARLLAAAARAARREAGLAQAAASGSASGSAATSATSTDLDAPHLRAHDAAHHLQVALAAGGTRRPPTRRRSRRAPRASPAAPPCGCGTPPACRCAAWRCSAIQRRTAVGPSPSVASTSTTPISCSLAAGSTRPERISSSVARMPMRRASRRIGAHAREQVEQDLREAQLRAFLGHDHVRGQRGLEAAAERVALHQRDGGQRRAVEALRARVQVVDAQPGVVRERVAVARLDQQHEQRQVAAQVEYPGRARGEHVVVGLAASGRRPRPGRRWPRARSRARGCPSAGRG